MSLLEPANNTDAEEIPNETNGLTVNHEEPPPVMNGNGTDEFHIRPVFLGNLHASYAPGDITRLFETKGSLRVDRIDVKRGYCFVFLQSVASAAEQERIQTWVETLNGM
jgi:hypothetical protein